MTIHQAAIHQAVSVQELSMTLFLDPSKPSEVYYVGEGDKDYALIQGFQPTQNFIFAAGAIAVWAARENR